jgi:hypothetical protein
VVRNSGIGGCGSDLLHDGVPVNVPSWANQLGFLQALSVEEPAGVLWEGKKLAHGDQMEGLLAGLVVAFYIFNGEGESQ